MTWDFRPYEGYGPIYFGTSKEEVRSILGQAAVESNSYESMKHAIDPDVIGEDYIDLLKKRTAIAFSDSADNNKRPELIFSDGTLVEIHLRGKRDSLIINGVDVWGSPRDAVIQNLARCEQTVLFSGSDYYFESVGLRVVAPKFWKSQGSISLYSHRGFEEAMDLSGPYEYAPDEITGREN